MKELLLITVSLFLTLLSFGQALSIADLEASVYIAEMEPASVEPINDSPVVQFLPTPIKKIQYKNTFSFPISIKEVPRTVYWTDRLEAKLAAKETKPVSNNIISNSVPKKKIRQFVQLKSNLYAGTLKSVARGRSYNLPFGVQQVNRTIYLTDKIEAHYAAIKNKEAQAKQNIEPEKAVVAKIEKEVVAVNSKTSAATSRGEIISRKELKSIVRRAKGKKSKYKEDDFVLKSTMKKPTTKVKSTNEDLVETKLSSTFHKTKVDPNHHKSETEIKPKYETEVVNRELAVLERMMREDNQKKSSPTTPNVNIPVTSQPLEVTTQMIDGESVITEVKPVASSATTNHVATTPNSTVGENRTIKAEKFSLKTIENESVDMNQLKGKVVVLNFWFTTCVECIREIPHLNELRNRYQGQEIEFVGICLNDKSKIESFLKKHPFEWKQIPNARKVAHDYYMFIYPGHAVVDKNGGIITLLNGNAPGVMHQLETAIQVGLGETF